jgi:hypothetical protein
MFGMFKSKKTQTFVIPPHPGPDPDGVTRVLPSSLWNGPNGDFLRQVTNGPDDLNNVIKTSQDIDAEFTRRHQHLDALTGSINAALPTGCAVVPWAMLPWSVWSGEHAEFLLRKNLFQVDAWNTMMLPADEQSAHILKLPQHLRGVPNGLDEGASRLIGEVRAELAKAHEVVATALAHGVLPDFSAYQHATEKAEGSVRGIAHYLGTAVYGDEAYAVHRQQFGSALGWAGA